MSSGDDFIVDGKPISELRVVDLKTQLEKRGLSKSGQKNILAKRLRDHLALEKIQEEQAGKDPNSAPNMEMKSCGSNIVAEYLERQQQALQAAKKAAQAVRAASSSFDDTETSYATPNETFRASCSPRDTARQNVLEGNGFEKNSSASAREAVENETEIAPVFDTPLNLSKDETPSSIAEEKSPEAKMVQEERAAAEETTTTAVEATAMEPAVESKEPVQDESDSRSDASSPSNDERRQRSSSESVDGKSNRSDADDNRAPSPVDDDESRHDVDEDNQKEIVEDGDEVEISAPQNVFDELMEAANAEKIIDNRKSSSKDDFPAVPVDVEITEKPQRKRKWGATTVGKRTTVSISSESLKDIVGPVTTAETTTTLDDPVQLDYDEDPIPKRIVISREDIDEEDTMESAVPVVILPRSQEKEIILTPNETVPDEDGLVRERSPSPARHPVNRIIHVRCLTRPFTMPALRDLLSKFGNYDKNEFWIDSIKSHCFVKYDTEEAATEARAKLDNAKWPNTNPLLLRVDFSTQDDLDRHRNKAKQGPTSKQPDQQTSSQPLISKENHADVTSKPKERVVREIRTSDEDRRRQDPSPIRDQDGKLWPKTREWDKGKDWKSGQSPPPPKGDRTSRRHSPSPSTRRIDMLAKKEEVPAKLLDDLFRKTKATPCIYWLPLTTDQAAERDKERKRRQDVQRDDRPRMEPQEGFDHRRRFDRGPRYSPYRRRY